MTRRLLERLPEATPLGVVLEGGYDLEALSESSEAVARALFGESELGAMPRAPLPSAVEAALAEIRQEQQPFWKLG
jgi:hypothetical protein